MISYGFLDFLGRIDPEKWIWEGYPTSNQPLPNIRAPTFRTETDDLESHEIQKAKSQRDETYPWVNEDTRRRVLKSISKVFIPLRPVLENWLLQSMERNQFRSVCTKYRRIWSFRTSCMSGVSAEWKDCAIRCQWQCVLANHQNL